MLIIPSNEEEGWNLRHVEMFWCYVQDWRCGESKLGKLSLAIHGEVMVRVGEGEMGFYRKIASREATNMPQQVEEPWSISPSLC